MKKIFLSATCLAILSGCSGEDGTNTQLPSPKVAETQLSATEISINIPLTEAEFSKNGQSKSLSLSYGLGSGAFHAKGDAANVFYTITDRGPNIKCKDADKILGINNFCPDGGDKIFPTPNFSPTIFKFKITGDQQTGYSTEILAKIPLKDQQGQLISGVTNQLQQTDTELAINNQGQVMAFDNNGLDTEALVKLADGSFWLSDEYGPSLVHVAANGQILQRIVPESIATDLANANYPVSGLLPDVLKHRKLNRGIESIALSPDEHYLYFIMQSPLAFPDKNAYKNSRHVRLFKIKLKQGDFSAVEGEYVYQLDRPASFHDVNGNGDLNSKQSDIKISEMLAVANDELVVLERISQTTKFYRISLSTGDNILTQTIANEAVTTNENEQPQTLEQVFDLASHQAKAVQKQLVFNTLTDMPANISAPSKIEGIALLDEQHVLLINDNDFGIEGDTTKAIILPIASKFTAPIAKQRLQSTLIARYQTHQFDQSAAEIVAYHQASQRIYVVNAKAKQVDILHGFKTLIELDNPLIDSNLQKQASIDTQTIYSQSGGVNSVAVHDDLLAVAVENSNKQANGVVAFYQLDQQGNATHLKNVSVGALPDNVQFSPDGSSLLAACEGEPSQDYNNDPEGKIAIINIINNMPVDNAHFAEFTAFNQGEARADELSDQVRIFGGRFSSTTSTVAQDLEPEYISFSQDSSKAFVTLQENNAIAVIDIKQANVTKILPLGKKDYGLAENAIDASDKDKSADTTGTLHQNGKSRINIRPWQQVVGLYQPDTIASYQVDNQTYLVTANEGDAREYIAGYLDETNNDQASCEQAGNNWDLTVQACYVGTTTSECLAQGLLNQANETCFSYLEEFRTEDLLSSGNANDFISPVPTKVASLIDNFSAELTPLLTDEGLGRLKISIADALDNNTQQITQLQSYGARSFSIWNTEGDLVFDSANDIERITAGRIGKYFNASNDKADDSKKNDRSSAKGPEPEAIAVGKVADRTYAFVGLERVGGIMIYDITNPYGVQFIDYLTNRDFSQDPSDNIQGDKAGDIGPEGMKFVSAEHSPTNQALLIIGNEVSGTTSVYQFQ